MTIKSWLLAKHVPQNVLILRFYAFLIFFSNCSMVCPGKTLFWVILYPLPALLLYSFPVILWFDPVFHTPSYSLLPTSDKIISNDMFISWKDNRYRLARFKKSKNCVTVFEIQLLWKLRSIPLPHFQQKFDLGCRCWNEQETLEYFLYFICVTWDEKIVWRSNYIFCNWKVFLRN